MLTCLKRCFLVLPFALICAAACSAATPGLISYQGRVLVSGAPFNGSGQFKFALVDATGATTYWSNDNTSTAGSEPGAAVSLTVTNGLYSVVLGDTTITNMTNAIPATVFANTVVKLRVWFNDGTNGSKQLAPDQQIAAVGYAMTAAGLSLPITTTVNGPGQDLLYITQSGSGNAIRGANSSNVGGAGIFGFASGTAGDAGDFITSNTSNAGNTLGVQQGGTNVAGKFAIVNATNGQAVIDATTNGTGPAGNFHQTNPANNNPAITATATSGGAALVVNQVGANGGGIQVISSGTNPGAIITVTNTITNNPGLTVTTPGGGPALYAEQDGSGNCAAFAITGAVTVGVINRSGNLVPPSDIRLKKNVKTLTNSLENVSNLRGVSFEWNNPAMESPGGTKTQLGFIAQELLGVYPEAVQQTSDGYYHANYTALIPVLTEAIKELKSQHEVDTRRIDALEARLTALEKK